MISNKPTIAFDVDGVLCNLMDVWLHRYNEDYEDSLTPSDIREWDVSLFVRPECGRKIFGYIEDPSIYDDCKPYSGALETVTVLRNYYNIKFVTAISGNTSGVKLNWLFNNGFFVKGDSYVEASDKSRISANILVDDYFNNVFNFVGHNGAGIGILYSRSWNQLFPYPIRMDDWESLFYWIGRLKSKFIL